jgi:hypothetical protein
MESLWELGEAARYLGITVTYLKNCCRAGADGPQFFRPSAKKTMFRKSDLDVWVKTWKTRETKGTRKGRR